MTNKYFELNCQNRLVYVGRLTVMLDKTLSLVECFVLCSGAAQVSLHLALFKNLTSLSVPAAEKHPYSIMLKSQCLTVWTVF